MINAYKRYKNKLSNLTEEEWIKRNVYLKGLADGTICGPSYGMPSVDKQWLRVYNETNLKSQIENLSAYQQLFNRNKNNFDCVALNYFDIKITYKKLFKSIDIIATALKEMNVTKGDVVAICMPNTPEAIFCFYAVNKIGAIANMIDVRFKTERLEECIIKSKSKVMFVMDAVVPMLSEKSIKYLEKIISISVIESLPTLIQCLIKLKSSKSNKSLENDKVIIYKEIMKSKKSKGLVETIYDKEIPALYEHTSGTTGASKIVVLMNKTFIGLVDAYDNYPFEKGEHDMFLNIIPPFMAYGILPSIHFPLCSGMQVVLIPKFEEEKFYDQLIKYKVVHTNATKLHWACVKKHVEELEYAIKHENNPHKRRKLEKQLSKADFSHLITGGIGGDAVNIEFEIQMNEFLNRYNCNNPLTKGYGMTEVGSTFCVAHKTFVCKAGSVGLPAVKNEIMIYDIDAQKELGYNEEGELYICGPTMMKEYLNDERTSETKVIIDNKEWIRTGDIAKITEDGALTIVGRKKRMIIVDGGCKVFPIVIENIIAKHEAVADVCVVGIPDEKRINIVKVHIILKDKYAKNKNEIIEEIKRMCEKEMPEQSLPSLYQIDKEFPKTPNQKTDIKEIERRDCQERA